jgi:hypothetical protein
MLLLFLSLGASFCTPPKTKTMQSTSVPDTEQVTFHLTVKETRRSKDTPTDQYEYQLQGDQLTKTLSTYGVHRHKETQKTQLTPEQMERIALYFECADGTLPQTLVALPAKSTTGALWIDIAFDYTYQGSAHTFRIANEKSKLRKNLTQLTVKTFQGWVDRYSVNHQPLSMADGRMRFKASACC